MNENPHIGLLHRDEVILLARQHLAPTTELLRDVTNYGTNLVVRCVATTSERTLKDLVICGVLLRQVVAMLDSVEVLCENGAVYAAHIPARALFEASVSIDWILKDDSLNKALHYYVSKLRKDRLWAARTQPGSAEATEFEQDVPAANRPPLAEEGKKKIEEIDRLLSLPAYVSINNAFEAIYQKRKREAQWYVPFGIRSVRQMSKAVGRATAYRVFYEPASEAVHGVNWGEHIQASPGLVSIQPIRHLRGIQTLMRFVFPTTVHTYQQVLSSYRPGELQAFSRKYVEEWRNQFWAIPDVQYRGKGVVRV